jgi:hypothetical protein
MEIHRETPPLTGSNVSNGGSVIDKDWTPSEYRIPPLSAKDFAASLVAKRFHLPVFRARLVCELAGLGGRIR